MDRPPARKRKALCAPLALVLATVFPALAQSSSSPPPQPTLIVYAHTDLENQGAPTLDVLDLERYFVMAFAERRIQHVAPSQTARQTRPPSPNTYVIEVSVNAIQASTRTSEFLGTYSDDPILFVELSLTIDDPGSSRVLGGFTERQEYRLGADEVAKLQPKRMAIYKTADRLVDRFVDGASEGSFGADLKSIQAPLSFASVCKGLGIKPLYGEIALGVLLFIFAVLVLVAVVKILKQIIVALSRIVLPLPKPKPDYVAWNNELKAALALALKTDNFSEAACEALAAKTREALLTNHARIESSESERQLTAEQREKHYEELATRGAASSGIEANRITDILRKTDAWEFRVLQAAKNFAAEVSK